MHRDSGMETVCCCILLWIVPSLISSYLVHFSSPLSFVCVFSMNYPYVIICLRDVMGFVFVCIGMFIHRCYVHKWFVPWTKCNITISQYQWNFETRRSFGFVAIIWLCDNTQVSIPTFSFSLSLTLLLHTFNMSYARKKANDCFFVT